MPRAKTFAYVCVGLLALAIAYHLGAERAGAQVVSGNPSWLMGEASERSSTYAPPTATSTTPTDTGRTWELHGHVFDAPIPVKQGT